MNDVEVSLKNVNIYKMPDITSFIISWTYDDKFQKLY